MTRPVACAAVVVGLLLGAVAAEAQPTRSGAFFGLGVGVGNLTVNTGDPGGGSDEFGSLIYGLHFGGLIAPRFGIGVALTGSSHTEEVGGGTTELTVYQRNLIAFAQYWVLERLWLRAGAGAATVGASAGDDDDEYPGVAAVGTIAFEVLHTPRHGLDVALGFWTAGYEGMVDWTATGTLELQFTWY